MSICGLHQTSYGSRKQTYTYAHKLWNHITYVLRMGPHSGKNDKGTQPTDTSKAAAKHLVCPVLWLQTDYAEELLNNKLTAFGKIQRNRKLVPQEKKQLPRTISYPRKFSFADSHPEEIACQYFSYISTLQPKYVVKLAFWCSRWFIVRCWEVNHENVVLQWDKVGDDAMEAMVKKCSTKRKMKAGHCLLFTLVSIATLNVRNF
jgi:hypothetical protein